MHIFHLFDQSQLKYLYIHYAVQHPVAKHIDKIPVNSLIVLQLDILIPLFMSKCIDFFIRIKLKMAASRPINMRYGIFMRRSPNRFAHISHLCIEAPGEAMYDQFVAWHVYN